MEYLPVISLVVSIAGLLIGFIIQYFTVIMKLKEDFNKEHTKLQENFQLNCSELKERIKGLEVKTDLFWKSIEKNLPNLLHSPHTPEMDKLLEKMISDGLNKTESIDLKNMIKNEFEEGLSENKKIVAVLLMARLDQIIED